MVARVPEARTEIGPDPAVTWLVEQADPAVARLAHRDLLGEPVGDAPASRVVQRLLTGLDDSVRAPYVKWTGAHWRLVSLVELGVAEDEPAVMHAADALLGYWSRPQRLAAVPVVDGRARRCASQEGNALAVACRLGLWRDDRAVTLAEHRLSWQWPDGGWNCDLRPTASHSSFHETLPALWGLAEYGAASGDRTALDAVGSAAELLLLHEVLYATSTGEPIHESFVFPHYPPFWHYDVLQALLVLERVGVGADPRTGRARQLLVDRRRPDRRWRAARRWWRPQGSTGSGVEAVDWGDVAHQMVTLNALRVGAR
ncbi:hypothetical protein [Cellulomonas sp. Root137]|uniref:hypothetical protein n=1 Tax=Cellulomonas sp. Root137 TaxID=1736459 RepID=UPI0006FD0F54|nr:hypothetical protein [Cellulomonas sp. Root137]KQY43838.1 hypothetical protein ASD18_15905 [Cellulomonas sp. Root137]